LAKRQKDSKQKEPKQEELFFVEVKDPGQVKRAILESLKSILELLKKFEDIKTMRQQKSEKIEKLKSHLREANRLFGTLKSSFPQTSLRPQVKVETQTRERPKEQKKSKIIVEAPRKELTEVDRLESEINAIEQKLRSLT